MIPIIALIGRQNVGKSTLFNLLTRSKDALVANFPGLTRDRKYGKAEFLEQEFIIIDTAGINNSEDEIKINITSQSLYAIKEADIIFFIVDVKYGLMSEDYVIVKYLRNCMKDIYLIANKIDGLDINIALSDFYKLGIKDIYPITASHGQGVNALLEKVVSIYSLKKSINNIELLKKENNANYFFTKKNKIVLKNTEKKVIDLRSLPIKLAIIGRQNVGKSTLSNYILREERLVVCNIPGTTRDSIYIPMERDGYKYILIDTAGVRRKRKITEIIEKFSVIKTLQSIKDANIVLLVIDAKQGISDQDLSLLRLILNAGCSLVIIINKWDDISEENRQLIKNILELRLGFIDFIKIHFISALYGIGINNLFKSIHEAYESATRLISTSLLMRIMKKAEEENLPPLIRGRRIKIKYAHIGGYNPPIIVIHGNQVTDLPNSYKRYLKNYFQHTLKIIGTPIRIQFKDGDNPYADKKNKLTFPHLRKCKYLMKNIKKH
ncbi:MAG: ribosome biogenesis GTPase Der [Arsenophonus sp. ET-YP4-MAG3]